MRLSPKGLLALGVSVLLVLTACSPAAEPATPAAPKKATTPAAKATTAPATKATTTPAPKTKTETPKTKTDSPAGPFMAADSAEWQAILDAAREEGELTVLGSRNPVIVAMAEDFEEEFGITLNYLELRSGETNERALAERDSGNRTASVVMTGDTAIAQLMREGITTPLTGLPNGANIPPVENTIFEESDNHYWPVFSFIYGLYINTDLVSEDEAPENWKDLLDPKWQGQIVQHHPGNPGGGHAFFEVTMDLPDYGEEFHRQLVAQDPLLVRGGGDVSAALARGERAIGLPGNPFELPALEGAPIEWLVMEDGLFRSVFVAAEIDQAPAPNAAKVFINWMLSEEVQTAFGQRMNALPSRSGVSNALDISIDSITFLGKGRTDPARTNETLELAQSIYGR